MKPIASQTDRQRLPYYRAAKSEVRKALTKDLNDLMTRLRGANTASELNYEASKQVKTTNIDKALRKIYKTTGKHFAEKTIKDLKSVKRMEGTQLSEDYWFAYMDRFVTNKLGNRIKWITGTTEDIFKSTCQRITTEGLADGLSVDKMTGMIAKELNTVIAWRAERIARTEVVSASNEASFAGAKSTGLELNKEWISFIDDKTRESHIEMDGKTAAIDEPFENGLMMPGDTNAEAEEVINCRCTIGYQAASGRFNWGREI
jgi:SPP1 gp7 family putative phage head morphogenesis protein